MAQSINIKIAGRPYNLTASSPDHEEVIRKAADEINGKIAQYQKNFPDKGIADILSFTALNVSMSNILLIKQLKEIKGAEDALARELESYLENIDKNGR